MVSMTRCVRTLSSWFVTNDWNRADYSAPQAHMPLSQFEISALAPRSRRLCGEFFSRTYSPQSR